MRLSFAALLLVAGCGGGAPVIFVDVTVQDDAGRVTAADTPPDTDADIPAPDTGPSMAQAVVTASDSGPSTVDKMPDAETDSGGACGLCAPGSTSCCTDCGAGTTWCCNARSQCGCQAAAACASTDSGTTPTQPPTVPPHANWSTIVCTTPQGAFACNGWSLSDSAVAEVDFGAGQAQACRPMGVTGPVAAACTTYPGCSVFYTTGPSAGTTYNGTCSVAP